MQRLVTRHAKAVYPQYGEPYLSEAGISESKRKGQELLGGETDALGSAAVSEMLRTRQTAIHLGFLTYDVIPSLNEVLSFLPRPEAGKVIENRERQYMDLVRARATALIENPPPHTYFITHADLMIGMTEVLGLRFDSRLPDFLEVREMDF